MVVVCYIEKIMLGVNRDNVSFHKKGKKDSSFDRFAEQSHLMSMKRRGLRLYIPDKSLSLCRNHPRMVLFHP